MDVARQRQSQIGVERALVEFVEQHRGDAVEHRIVEDQRVKMPSVMISMRVFARDFRAEPHAQAHRFADPLAQVLRHALGGGARGEPPRLQHQDAASLGPASSASTSGTRVVLPAPGGATSTAALRARKAR